MKREELAELIDSWENLTFLIREIGSDSQLFSVLMEIVLYDSRQKSWRAAYLADKINDDFPRLILPYIEKIIQQLGEEKNSSKKRHFLKLLSMNEIPGVYYGFLVDYCLNVMSSAKEPPAVRVHAMQVLFNISEEEPDLKPELLSVIGHEMEYHATPGILSRGTKLVKKLQKQVQQKF